MSNRVNDVVYDMVLAVREVLDRHDVQFSEYRAAVAFAEKYLKAAPFEISLTADLFFEGTIHDIEMKPRKGTATNLEGPYFLEDAPIITDKILARNPQAQPLHLEGKVTDIKGRPLEGAELFIWHSDEDGFYSGMSEDFPIKYCRGKVIIGPDGKYSVRTIMPAPYTIPDNGPTGELLALMGRHPWRPAHVHWKVRHPDIIEHTTQSYFHGGKWVDDDCVEGVRPSLVHKLEKKGGIPTLRKDFKLDPAPSEKTVSRALFGFLR